MRYDILHEVPGRMRVHCRNLSLRPQNRIELNRWVSQHTELASATLSTRTGNLLIVYARTVERRAILTLLDDLHLFEDANIGNSADDVWSLSEATLTVALHEVFHTVAGAVLPKPLNIGLSGWKVGSCAIAVGDAVRRQDFLGCCFAIGKYVLFGLYAASLPARFLLHLTASFVNHLLNRRQPPLPSRELACDHMPTYAPAFAVM